MLRQTRLVREIAAITVERLRFSIDPGWYGELPRSYFYDAEHNMMSHSGILTEEKFRELFPH